MLIEEEKRITTNNFQGSKNQSQSLVESLMNVIIAPTKSCRHCPMIKKELRKLGVDSSVHYFEEHPELVERYNIKHSPLIIVDDVVIFNGMPNLFQLSVS